MTAEEKYTDEIYDKLAKVLQNKASDAEVNDVDSWLSQNPENSKSYEEFRAMWQLSGIKSSTDAYDPDMAWKNVMPLLDSTPPLQESQEPKSSFVRSLLKIAAIVVVAFGLGMLTMVLFQHRATTQVRNVFTEQIVPYGSKSQVTLPDGTKIWLNAGSSLKYSQDYNARSREVFLEGEAYFEVTANKHLPFVVKTYGVMVKVVGTAFNLKAYREEKKIEAVVDRGTVKLYGTDSLPSFPKELVLTAKQKVTIGIPEEPSQNLQHQTTAVRQEVATPKITLTNNVETILYTSWKDKRWIIEREELGSLAVKIGRRYDVEVEFESEALKHFTFSGIIEDETLGQVLKVISLTAPVSYTLDKKHLVLKENKSLLKYFPVN